MGAIAAPFSSCPYFGGFGMAEPAAIRTQRADQDPHLRSVAEVDGYHAHTSDGDIGHTEHLLVEDTGLRIRYLIIDARSWWAGQHVLVSPFAVREINWSKFQMRLDVMREKINASPAWQAPPDQLDQISADRLHGYYGWPGYQL